MHLDLRILRIITSATIPLSNTFLYTARIVMHTRAGVNVSLLRKTLTLGRR